MLWEVAVRVVARFAFVREPTVSPNLSRTKHPTPGLQDDADGLVVVQDQW